MGHSRRSMLGIAAALAAAVAMGAPAPASAQKTLRAVMHSDLKILDPIWTTAYIVRNHGYMVYDTLFATDATGAIKPQMVDKHEVSADQLTHTFTLRDGLAWHDGAPVTAEDCVASIKRWAAKDSTGQKLMTFVDGLEVKDAKTFAMKLKSPTGLVLLGLGKPSSNVPFMMPKRVAETDPNTPDLRFHGLGSLHLQARRVEARRQDRLRQECKLQAALRARLRPRRRQGGQGRPRRMARHLRPPAGRQCAAGRRDRLHRGAAARPAAARARRRQRQLFRLEPLGQPVHLPAQLDRKALRQSQGAPGADVRLQPGGLPEGRGRRCQVLQGLQLLLPLRHAVLQREGHGRPLEIRTSRKPRTCSRKPATTARRSC